MQYLNLSSVRFVNRNSPQTFVSQPIFGTNFNAESTIIYPIHDYIFHTKEGFTLLRTDQPLDRTQWLLFEICTHRWMTCFRMLWDVHRVQSNGQCRIDHSFVLKIQPEPHLSYIVPPSQELQRPFVVPFEYFHKPYIQSCRKKNNHISNRSTLSHLN